MAQRLTLDISSYLITKFFEKAEILKIYHPHTKVWADYLFLASCHAKVIGDDEKVVDLINKIKDNFPNYDPFSRFSWDKLFSGKKSEDIYEDTLQEKIIAMDDLHVLHPGFAFYDQLRVYFKKTDDLD